MSARKNFVLKFVISVVFLSGIAAVVYHEYSKSKRVVAAPSVAVPSVTLKPLRYATVPLKVAAYAATVAPTAVNVAAKNSGTIVQIFIKPGQKVSKGQQLFKIHSTDVNAQLAALKAALSDSKAKYTSYQLANKQAEGSVSKRNVIEAYDEYQKDLAAYAALQDQVYVRAAVAGVVSDTELTVGETVQPGQVLLTVVPPHSLQIKYELDSNYAQQVKSGQRVSFQPTGAANSYAGTVVYVSPLMNIDSQNIVLRADLATTAGLAPNVFGRVEQVIDPRHKSLLVAQNMVQTDAQGFYLYGVQDGKVTKLYFTPGDFVQRDKVIIRSGIKAGTNYIASGISQLAAGQKVKVQP